MNDEALNRRMQLFLDRETVVGVVTRANHDRDQTHQYRTGGHLLVSHNHPPPNNYESKIHTHNASILARGIPVTSYDRLFDTNV